MFSESDSASASASGRRARRTVSFNDTFAQLSYDDSLAYYSRSEKEQSEDELRAQDRKRAMGNPGSRRRRRYLNDRMSDVETGDDSPGEDEQYWPIVDFDNWESRFTHMGSKFSAGAGALATRKTEKKRDPATQRYLQLPRRVRSILKRCEPCFVKQLEDLLILFKHDDLDIKSLAQLPITTFKLVAFDGLASHLTNSQEQSIDNAILSANNTAYPTPKQKKKKKSRRAKTSSQQRVSKKLEGPGLSVIVEDSYYRMLVHGLCMYHDLVSSSETRSDGWRYTRICKRGQQQTNRRHRSKHSKNKGKAAEQDHQPHSWSLVDYLASHDPNYGEYRTKISPAVSSNLRPAKVSHRRSPAAATVSAAATVPAHLLEAKHLELEVQKDQLENHRETENLGEEMTALTLH